MLKRYWFVIYPEQRYGPLNAGVSAFSSKEAREILIENFKKINYWEPLAILKAKEDMEVIENIDIRLLDKGHVIPNMGVVTFKGVWFPRLNMHEDV